MINMKCIDEIPEFAGGSYLVEYEGLSAINTYNADASVVRYEIISGVLKGTSGHAACQWKALNNGLYAISWQEENGATVLHLDNFTSGQSSSFFTSSNLDFYRLEGRLSKRDEK